MLPFSQFNIFTAIVSNKTELKGFVLNDEKVNNIVL